MLRYEGLKNAQRHTRRGGSAACLVGLEHDVAAGGAQCSRGQRVQQIGPGNAANMQA